MSAKHTPGPWSVEDPIEHELSIVEAGKQDYEWKFIATVPYGGQNDGDFPRSVADANARLIAAAPDLLTTLRDLLAECDRHGCFGEVSMEFPTIKPIFDAARRAVANAEGRS
jgi:hypothetical protein